jgi:hypothetical protein
MRLEDITAEVRPRGRWEAVDLGFAMVRRHFGRLLIAWLADPDGNPVQIVQPLSP